MKNKLIFDFDGIFAADMLYNENGKELKSFPWGIRHSIDVLKEHGFEVYIITGDSTTKGQAITSKFLENTQVEEIIFCNSKDKLTLLRNRFDLSECIYCGDDIYDIEVFKQTYGIVPYDAHTIFNSYLDYRSAYTTRSYFFMDLTMHILQKFRYENIDEDSLSEFIVKQTAQQPFRKMLNDKSYFSVFILQQYSMRNHTDGNYNPLLDGNLNLTLHRIYDALKNNDRLKIKITIPENTDDDQYRIMTEFIEDIELKERIEFIKIPYGKNAYENRSIFKDTSNIKNHYLGSDLIVTDFSGSKFRGTAPIMYNYNISKVAELNRIFVDEFFEPQVTTALATEDFVYVLNENQKQFMIKSCNNPMDRLIIKSNVIVDTDIINNNLFEKQVKFFSRLISIEQETDLTEILRKAWYQYDHIFFLPFRLTDECYRFKKILELCDEKSDRDICIIVTNPNDGDLLKDIPSNVYIMNIADKFEDLNKKSLYFNILENIEKINVDVDANLKSNDFIGPGFIQIPIFEDPSIVLHQSLIEMQLLCPNGVNFIPKALHKNPRFETLLQNKNNNYIKSLSYSNHYDIDSK